MPSVGQSLLIVGSDTDVGKTIVTTALLAYWLRFHDPDQIAVMKPLQTGIGDRERYGDLFADLHQPPETITPLRFEAPLAPPLAADREGRTIDLGPVWNTLHHLTQHYPQVLVEALGGLGSPVTHEWTVADWAAAWQLPIVLVIPVKLGAIAHTVANVALARQHKLDIRGIILNCPTADAMARQADWTPIPLMEQLTQVPILGTLPWLEHDRDRPQLATAAAALNLNALWPHLPTVPVRA
jgi:dethiobiotin synthetase